MFERGMILCLLLLVMAGTREVIGFSFSSSCSGSSSSRSKSKSKWLHQQTVLSAKKKASKFVSDGLLDALEAEGAISTLSPTPTPVVVVESIAITDTKVPVESEANAAGSSASSSKKKKKKAKFSFDDFSFDDVDNSKGGKQKQSTEEPALSEDVFIAQESSSSKAADDDEERGVQEDNEDEAEMAPVQPADGLTMEQRARKEKPKSRIRFAESSQPDFVMMSLDHVSLIYGNDVILKDATLSVSTGQRVGLVGPNGSGKTTQMKILAGELEPTTGDVVKSSKDLRVAMLRQEFIDELDMTRTLREELLQAFDEEQRLLKGITELEEEVSRTTDDPERMEQVLNKLQDLQDKAIAKGAYSLDSKVDKIMDATGFTVEDGSALVKSFSGGWKMRIGLAKILLKDPNVLLLDEPTNHLDLESVFWLEDFLVKRSLPMVIVSHDREFLDKVCNRIVDVEEGVTVAYEGNYSEFLAAKTTRLDQWKEKYERQVRYIKEEEKWIKKAKNDPHMSQQVKDKEMQLEAYKSSEERVAMPPKDKKFRFRFPPCPRCGESVVEGKGLGHGYGEGVHKVLFSDVDIQVNRMERVGFVGPNGAGKSTLMRIIAGREEPKHGYAEYGNANVEANYFAQNQADEFDMERSVLDTVQEDMPSDYTLTDLRALLGQFMFKGDDVDKKLKVLSGGEKARVALCKMMLTPANLLLLDEPTNHLDITAKEVLEDALQHFEGSVLIISHDRYFMSQTANTIFSFKNKSVTKHQCDYHDYMLTQEGLRDRVMARSVIGDKYKITNAKEPIKVENVKSKKNFGGSGVTSGNLFKGIKNAKRYQA